MNRGQFAHRYYTSTRVTPFAPPGHHMGHFGPGMCRSCGQPSDKCCCGCRECRKESKELLVESRGAAGTTGLTGAATHTQNLKMETFVAEAMNHPILARGETAAAAA